jgi:hypothetical protein
MNSAKSSKRDVSEGKKKPKVVTGELNQFALTISVLFSNSSFQNKRNVVGNKLSDVDIDLDTGFCLFCILIVLSEMGIVRRY